jgi:pimeloyl-ACP methyl ester carboxylesterase
MNLAVLTMAVGVFNPAPCALEGVPADFERKNGIQCGWVAVPLRQDKPDGKSIRLWTARVRATGSDRQEDPVLYINGGPGIATVEVILPAINESKSLTRLRQSRDIILFDQRGSGRSEASLCPDLGKRLNAIEAQGLDPAQEDARSTAEFASCRARLDEAELDIEAYTTSATVADMESLRQAFAVDQWNLLSISYGSLVAMHAMRESPGPIRSVILNSPYPTNSVTWAEQASSAAAAYMAIDRECSAQPACRARFGSIQPKLEATLARLERAPLSDGKALITGRRFAEALWPMAVRSSTVRFVPLAIERAYAGDEATIRKMVAKYAGGDSFGGYSPAQGWAITCHESGRTARWYARAKALYPTLVSAAPADGMDKLCAAFRPGFADPSFFAPVASAIPTLIYAGSLDPATPVVDAYQATRFLENATLVEVPGAAHGPMGLDACTLGIGAAFVDDPSAKPDLGCMIVRRGIEFASDGLDDVIAPPADK